jgi:octaprenyl-diphosphate synthase
MSQNHHRGDTSLNEATYFDIIRGKTAELTAVSSALGAYFAESEPHVVDSIESFGRNLGIAFQIVDDLLDLLGDERNTGKSLGTDLDKMKLTLPLIRYLASASAEDAAQMKAMLDNPEHTAARRKSIKAIVARHEVIDDCWRTAQQYVEAARGNLSVLEESPSKAILMAMTDDVVKRAF